MQVGHRALRRGKLSHTQNLSGDCCFPDILDVGTDGNFIEREEKSALVGGGSPTTSVRSDSPETTGRLSPRGTEFTRSFLCSYKQSCDC